MARRVRGSRHRPVPLFPSVLLDLSRYLGRRGPGPAGLGHAAWQPAAARLDHRGRDVLHDRSPPVRAHRAGPGARARCGPHRGRQHLYAAGAGGRPAGPGTRDRAGRADPPAGRGRDHARTPVRQRHPPAALPARPPGHPAPAAARLPAAGPRAATLAPIHTLPRRVVVAFEGILNIYGGDFFHISQNSPFGPALGGLPVAAGIALAAVHLVGVALAAWGFFRAFRYFFDPSDLISPVLATAIAVNVAAYVLS